jgi:hypothetical protein
MEWKSRYLVANERIATVKASLEVIKVALEMKKQYVAFSYLLVERFYFTER